MPIVEIPDYIHQDDPILPPGFDLMGHTDSREDLDTLAQLVPEGSIVIEIGAWAGLSTLWLAKRALRVYSIDHWKGNETDLLRDQIPSHPPDVAYHTFLENLTRADVLWKKVIPVRAASVDAARGARWLPPCDLLFVDGDHTQCQEDLEAWLPRVLPGGTVVVHDATVFPEVDEAVKKLLPGAVKMARTLAVWQKP